MTWLPSVVTVAPASEPLTLDEAKAQCRVDGTDSDTLLTSYIAQARSYVERYTGTKLVSQTVLMRAGRFCDLRDLPAAPIIAVSSVTYLDTDGAEQTLSTDVYEVVIAGLSAEIRRKAGQVWPSIRCASDAIRVTATVGYAVLEDDIKGAMRLLIEQWHDERSSVSSVRQSVTPDGGIPTLPNTVADLLANYRRF